MPTHIYSNQSAHFPVSPYFFFVAPLALIQNLPLQLHVIVPYFHWIQLRSNTHNLIHFIMIALCLRFILNLWSRSPFYFSRIIISRSTTLDFVFFSSLYFVNVIVVAAGAVSFSYLKHNLGVLLFNIHLHKYMLSMLIIMDNANALKHFRKCNYRWIVFIIII